MFNYSINKHELICIVNITKVFFPIIIKCFILVIFAFKIYKKISFHKYFRKTSMKKLI